MACSLMYSCGLLQSDVGHVTGHVACDVCLKLSVDLLNPVCLCTLRHVGSD